MSADLSTPSPEALRDVFARFPTGVAVVCARDSEGISGGMTANAICSLSLDPLLVLVCFQREARTLPLVERAGRFSISVLEAGRGDLARRFASREIEESDKLQGVPFSEVDGLPVLDAAIAWTVCSVRDLLPGGDHTIAIGEVESLGSREGDPLVWHRGNFTGLEPADPQ